MPNVFSLIIAQCRPFAGERRYSSMSHECDQRDQVAGYSVDCVMSNRFARDLRTHCSSHIDDSGYRINVRRRSMLLPVS